MPPTELRLKLSLVGFNPAYYIYRHVDLRAAYGPKNNGGKPDYDEAMLHYRLFGVKEGRSPNPFFVPDEYRKHIPRSDTRMRAMSNSELLLHWLDYGAKEGRQGSDNFYTKWYYRNHSDFPQYNIGKTDEQKMAFAFNHWKNHGHFERRRTSQGGRRLQLAWLDAFDPINKFPLIHSKYDGVTSPFGTIDGSVGTLLPVAGVAAGPALKGLWRLIKEVIKSDRTGDDDVYYDRDGTPHNDGGHDDGTDAPIAGEGVPNHYVRAGDLVAT